MPSPARAGVLPVALACAFCADAAPSSESHTVERLVAGSAFHGVHGLAFDRNDTLYAGSVVGQSVYRVDTANGKVATIAGPPAGMADDIVFLDDGTMVWTAIQQGVVYARKGTEPPRQIARLPSVNSINVRRRDGRLFVGQVFGGDGVWELDPAGVNPPRSIVRNPGGFNGFDIGPDGMLYGPLWFKHQVVRIDPDTGAMKVIADGFHTPAAADFDSKWNLYVLDTAVGEVIRVDIARGSKRVVARLDTSLDNLAIDSRDRMFVSNMADNGIQEIDVATGTARQVLKGDLAIPLSIAAIGDTIYVADVFAFRSVDGSTGEVTDIARSHAAGTPIGYPVAVTSDDRNVVLTNSEGLVQKYPHGSNTPSASWHLRAVRNAFALPGDELLVAFDNGNLARLSGAATEGTVIASKLGNVTGITLDKDRTIAWLVDATTGQALRLDLQTGATKVVAKGLHSPRGLAVTSRGDLLTIDMDARRLVRIDPSGSQQTIATDLPVGGEGNPTMAAGIAVGKGDVIYVSSDVENSLWKFTPKVH